MGQYYKPTILNNNLKIKGYLNTWDYNDGLKLMEHSYLGTGVTNAVLSEIKCKSMRIAWIGDYADDPYPDIPEEPYQKKLEKSTFMKIWNKVYGDSEKPANLIKPELVEGFNRPKDFDGWYLINHYKHEYVDLGRVYKENSWAESWYDKDGNSHKDFMAIHPLPLLTACGNNRGGGDYHESYPDFDLVGTWAFDLIEFTNKIPSGYTEKIVKFKE